MSNDLLQAFVERSPPESLPSTNSPPSPSPCCSFGDNASKHASYEDMDCLEMSNTRELKVDKRILEIMKKGGDCGMNVPSLNTFFAPIRDSGVELDFSSSFRDRQGNSIPIVKVTSANPDTLEKACATIMQFLDPHRDKMTFNIDVPSADHSFIIGKDGSRIKGLSKKTGCHIHLPDCNKVMGKKSNKITIAGTTFESIEYARDQIRKQLPLNVMFNIRVSSRKMPLLDASSSDIQNIKRIHQVDVNFYGSNNDGNFFGSTGYREITVSVKGTRLQLDQIDQTVKEIYKIAYDTEYQSGALRFEIVLDISSNNHQFVRGKGNCNLKVITNRTGGQIHFPAERSNVVRVRSESLESVVMCWQELMGFLPLVLSFDLNLPENIIKDAANEVEKSYNVNVRIREKLASSIFTLFIKTQERHSIILREIRQKFLDRKSQESENSPQNSNRAFDSCSFNQVPQTKSSFTPPFEQPASMPVNEGPSFNDGTPRAFGVDLSNQPAKQTDLDFQKYRSMLANPAYAAQMIHLSKLYDQHYLPTAFNALNNSGCSTPPGFQTPIAPLQRNSAPAFASFKPPAASRKVSPTHDSPFYRSFSSDSSDIFQSHHKSPPSGMGSFWTGNPILNRSFEKEPHVHNDYFPQNDRCLFNSAGHERKMAGGFITSPPRNARPLFNAPLSPIHPVQHPRAAFTRLTPDRDFLSSIGNKNNSFGFGNQMVHNQSGHSVNSPFNLFNMQQMQTPAIPLPDSVHRRSMMEQTPKNIMESSFSSKSTSSSYQDSACFNSSFSSTSTAQFPMNSTQSLWFNDSLAGQKRSKPIFETNDFSLDDFKENQLP